MLHELLKVVIYLSILRTTTSSGYLAEESVVNFRRASPGEQQSQLSKNGEGFEWAESSVAEPSDSQYFIPKFVNVNNMLFTQLNRDNNNRNQQHKKKLNQRVRGKKDNNNKLINSKNNKLANLIKNYDNLSKRKNIASSYNNESNALKNDTASVQTQQQQQQLQEDERKFNLTNINEDVLDASSRHLTSFPQQTNEYPINQISSSAQHDRELQQLFGIEGAKKYQDYQLKQQQQLLNDNDQQQQQKQQQPQSQQHQQFQLTPEDEGVELKEPAKKRSGSMNGEEMQDVSGAMVNQIMPRTTRRQREYDVPLIRK